MNSNIPIWDVVVVGGGASGMMAAARAGERGRKVLLLEKNEELGKKLLISGGGRCNLTNNTQDMRDLLPRYGDAEQFLYSPFAQFGISETLEYFHARGLKTKVEAEDRVFPESNSARSVWNVLVAALGHAGVVIHYQSAVINVLFDNNIAIVKTKNGREYHAHRLILATGGTSHPETGSTGDGFAWLRTLGHTVNLDGGALVPVEVQEEWVKNLSGLALEGIKITAHLDGVKKMNRKGKMLFTHFGVSGPAVLNMSSGIGELLHQGKVDLVLDLLPQKDPGALNIELNELLRGESNKQIKNVLEGVIPKRLVMKVLEVAQIDESKECHSVTREERLRLTAGIKDLHMHILRRMGPDKAVVTSGGVPLTEIDTKTMRSLRYPNLFLIGDILDIDRPSGGYSLQLCWTTGWVAGSSV